MQQSFQYHIFTPQSKGTSGVPCKMPAYGVFENFCSNDSFGKVASHLEYTPRNFQNVVLLNFFKNISFYKEGRIKLKILENFFYHS